MKKDRLSPMFLFIVLPLLLANSPAPYPSRVTYEQFSATPVIRESIDEENFIYTTTVTNTGENYISVESCYLISEEGQRDLYFENQSSAVILPGKSYEVVFTSKTELEPSSLSLRVNAFIPLDSEYTYSNITNLKQEETSYSDEFLYTYDIDIVVETNNYYGFITIYTYEGETFASHNRHHLEEACFYSDKLMDVEYIAIEEVLLIKGRSKSNSLGQIFGIIALGLVIFSGALILVIGLPIVITVLLVIRHKKKKQI